jgi:osmotically-inducible protein OsmY
MDWETAMDARNLLIVLFTLGGVSALIACLTSRSIPETQAATSPTGVGSPSAANAKLEKAVKSMLAQDEQVRRANLSVRADVTKNEVTLSGTVESEAVRARAVELAKTAQVGVMVNDKTTVKRSGQGARDGLESEK